MDIYRALKKLLKDNFEGIQVQTKDVKNPHPPCFYIKSVADTSRQTGSEYETTDYSFNIIYFSGNETAEDLLTIKERLKKLLKKPIKVVAYEDETCISWVEINSVDFTLDEDDYFFNAVLTIEHIQPMGVDRFESENNSLMDEMELDTEYRSES